MRLGLSFVLGVLISVSSFAEIDMGAVEKDLTGTGLRGWIHGAVHDYKEYVFTFRDPTDFFNHAEFSVLPANAEVKAMLEKANRHDEVLLFGTLGTNPSSQKHLVISKIKLIAAFDPGISVPARHREAKLPDDLRSGTSLLATVHAIAADGEIMVVEYKDAVLPVFVKEKALTRDLFRGDKIRLHYLIQRGPKMPVHLGLDPAVKPAVEVLERVEDVNGKKLTLEGALVYFPKSPQIRFGIFALQVVDKDGLKLNYTLVNFDDPDQFTAIRKKLDGLWAAGVKTAEDARNSFINQKIRIRAEGIGNVASPNQANPQILLDGPDSITVLP
jgi:hypothetical protein